jgi:predicted DNA binding CopG/RHH family protein
VDAGGWFDWDESNVDHILTQGVEPGEVEEALLDPEEIGDLARKRKEIKGWDEVPSFTSEKEEQAWWDEHDISEELLETFEPRSERDHLPPPREKIITRPRKAPISVRMENDLVNRLKALAAVKGVGYQTLLRQFVAERVYEEEKREGIIEK